jgi:hypothetical protein
MGAYVGVEVELHYFFTSTLGDTVYQIHTSITLTGSEGSVCISWLGDLVSFWGDKNLLPLPRMEQHICGCPAHNIFTIDTRIIPLTSVYQVINIYHFIFRVSLSLWISYLSYWDFINKKVPACCELRNAWIYLTYPALTLILPTWSIWWAFNNASKWQMGFNLAFKELIYKRDPPTLAWTHLNGSYCIYAVFLYNWHQRKKRKRNGNIQH